ncbi:MAG: SBBP repeat-containing protein [Phycisphaerales bacterium]|nr:MAG: SBBP repeat-containing protein [Phycisphaerales bacterium]
MSEYVCMLGATTRRLILLVLVMLSGLFPIELSAAVVTEQWVARYDGPGNADDYAKAMAVDASGNVYVTGYSHGAKSSYDYATAKYDGAGNLLWLARYDGPGKYDDQAAAVAVDHQGNVYVSGHSYSAGAGADYATIKYNAQGIEQWAARYNGPGNDNDIVFDMVLDASGHVYVTGEGDGGDSRRDYTTIKYDPDGNVLWVAVYDGVGHHQDSARAIAIDKAGNVYVTGHSYTDNLTREDFATVKYDALGNEVWTARYIGPATPPYSGYDTSEAIAVDETGHVYVTGYSDTPGTGYDYTTIEYDAQGIEQWVARYNGTSDSRDYAQAIALDASGCVYVTGYSQNLWTGQDYTTIKYDGNGTELWTAIFDGGIYHNDRARDITLDRNGCVYVTGYSYGHSTQYDCTTVKYDKAGNELWIMSYDGPETLGTGGLLTSPDSTESDCDYAYTVAVDGPGNVYITGSSFGGGSRYDYTTVKYSQEDTPAGAGVQIVDPATGVTIRFEAILAGGNTAVTMTPSASFALGLSLVPAGMLYEMSTTAQFSGTIDIAIPYEGHALSPAQEDALRLWHYEDATNKWIDVTAYADTANNIIRGVSPGLSFFAVTVTP